MAYQKYNWPEIFEKFDSSGLSQTEFCKQHNLNTKYFNLKLSKRKAQDGGAFAKAIVQLEPASPEGLTVEVGHCKIHCPATMSIPSFVSLVRSLA
ncbi:IS66 family insertion sequence element accessory protein TnpA [Teredinibacter franksiae]|jgi:hypothetical protein|uniref:IS66 family insertion sequence element accessory protein TnpA n=1 Tax=Teredinibacter franksiae TaxID=2761453 RepID=UPI001629AFAE|nr:hypothetical protein [Teredinibacter franksiae]